MKDIREKIAEEKNAQLRSIPAQRLIEKLSLLKNRVSDARKRWFWELLQNASDYNESVNVKLTISDDKVVFSHDGAPFSVRDTLNLISPDSNKQGDVVHKDNIGKFGTGLVSTHILSSLLEIQGVFEDDEKKYYQFSVKLDRTCYKDKNALINQITQAEGLLNESIKEVDSANGILNSFSYKLGVSLPDLPILKATDIDVEYLLKVLPYTLCFMHKVKSVVIDDLRLGSPFKKYSISRSKITDKVIEFCVEKDANVEKHTFAYFTLNNVASAFEFKGDEILPYPTGMSRLFCGLPLIGTEEIGLPIIINSFKFTPTIEREGVEIEPSHNEENREQITNSILLYNNMLSYVAGNKMKNAFYLARLRNKYNGTQASNLQFANIFLRKYKDCLLKNNIVRIDGQKFSSLSTIKLPFKESKSDVDLYKLCSNFNATNLPVLEDYEAWFDVVDFVLFSEQKYTCLDLAKQISANDSIYEFGKKTSEVLSWLCECASYFMKNAKDIFTKYKLLPNQSGKLCIVDNKLYTDNDLPNDLKEIYNLLFELKGEKVGDKLLDPIFNKLKISNNEFTLRMLATEIDDKLSTQYSENKGDVSKVQTALNKLYNWISKSDISKEDLASYFHWYYPKRATLIVDMLSETQREHALTIAQSGRMEQLATLAVSDISDEEFKLIVANINKIPACLSLIIQQTDDKTYADAEGGDIGEQIVYKDLIHRFPVDKGFRVIWASKERNEPCYDFEITKNGKIFMYCDAKTTSRGISNSDSIPFFMRKSQWNFLENLNDEIPYVIARVFMKDGGMIRYMRLEEHNC